MALCHEVC